MNDPVSHRALLSHDRVMAAAIAAKARSMPSRWWYYLALILALSLAIWLGHFAAFMVIQRLPFDWMFAIGRYVPVVVPALVGLCAVIVVDAIFQRLAQRAYLRNFDRLDIPRTIEATFEILPAGLRVTTPRITILPKWATIDTVERVDDGWVISADQLTFLAPHGSFAGPEDERRFVRALVAPLGDAARKRSPMAVAFAEAEVPVSAAPPATDRAAVPKAGHQPSALLARGKLGRHEASWAAQVAYYAVTRGKLHGFAFPALSALAGGLTGLTLAGVILLAVPLQITLGNVLLFAGMAFLLPLFGSAIGLWLGNRRLTTVLGKAYQQALDDRGSPAEVECEWEVLPEGLTMRSQRATTVYAWPSISELMRQDEYWVAMSDIAAITLPRRAFADADAERAFVAAVLARMDASASERSAEARRLVGTSA